MAQHALFICYSHTDQRYREQFSKFLQTVKEKQHVDVFSDAEIKPGDDWQKKIVDNLRKATAALVLVSQDVLVSPFIQQVELREILESRTKNGLRLFLVAVRAVTYKGTYLEQFQWARAPDMPLSLLPEAEQEVAMVDVCMKIARELGTKVDLILLTYPETREQGEPTILSGIARTHTKYEPQQFDAFREAVVKAVEKHDPRGAAAAAAWREAITPGLDYLKSKAGTAAQV